MAAGGEFPAGASPVGWALRPRITGTFVNGVLWVLRSGRPVERPAPGVWQLEKRPQAFHPAGPGPESGRGSSKCCWMTPDNRYVMIDST